jgi:hypothetical protein
MNIRWLLRAKKWAENPPSWKRVKMGLYILAICIALATFEHFFGWPDALTPENVGRRPPIPQF